MPPSPDPQVPAAPPRRKRRIVLGTAVLAVAVLGGAAAWTMTQGGSSLVRPRLAEMLLLASACREAVDAAYANSAPGRAPAIDRARCDPSSPLAQLAVDEHGAIRLTARGVDHAEVDGRSLLLVPYHDGATPKDARNEAHRSPIANWSCRSPAQGGIPGRFLPKACRADGQGS